MENNTKTEEKKHTFEFTDILLGSVTIVAFLVNAFLPETGPMVLLKEIVASFMMLSAGLLALGVLVRIWRQKENRFATLVVGTVVVIFMAVGVISFVDVAQDLTNGPQEATLTGCKVESEPSGIYGQRYYLTGIDEEGNECRLHISGRDYETLKNHTMAYVVFYTNTKRVQSLWALPITVYEQGILCPQRMGG